MIGKMLSLFMEKSVIPDVSPKIVVIAAIAFVFVILFSWPREA